jgi:hypothetical protein
MPLRADLLERAKARVGVVLNGKWRLDEVLGIGGMATVYGATHRNQKRVAIKMLHPEVSIDQQVTSRFTREAVDDNCNADKRCNATGYDAAQSGKTLGMVTTTGLVLGAIGIGVGAYLLLTDENGEHPTAVTAGLIDGGAGLAIRRGWWALPACDNRVHE